MLSEANANDSPVAPKPVVAASRRACRRLRIVPSDELAMKFPSLYTATQQSSADGNQHNSINTVSQPLSAVRRCYTIDSLARKGFRVDAIGNQAIAVLR